MNEFVRFERSGWVQGWMPVGKGFYHEGDVLVDGSIYKVPEDCILEKVAVTSHSTRRVRTNSLLRFYIDDHCSRWTVGGGNVYELNKKVKAGTTLGFFFEESVSDPVIHLELRGSP